MLEAKSNGTEAKSGTKLTARPNARGGERDRETELNGGEMRWTIWSECERSDEIERMKLEV
jgi:hypothetical protein